MARAHVYPAVVALLVLLLLTSMSASAATSPGGVVLRERRIAAIPSGLTSRSREPIAAAHPFSSTRVAVVYSVGDTAPRTVIRISHDAGATWTTATGHPRGGGNHPVVAWGPGPVAGKARLYYIAMTSSGGVCCYFGISHSDNEGATWSAPYVSTGTRPWFGGYPDMAVDTNPDSPNYGVVYVAYNWLRDPATGTGMHVIASADFGRTWRAIEVPPVAAPRGYGDTWRIGYRVRPAPDGSVYVSGYQLNLNHWNVSSPFSTGGAANVGRIGFSVTHLRYRRSTKSFWRGPTVMAATLAETSWTLGSGSTNPQWSSGLAVDPDTGAVYLAFGGARGTVVYRSTNGGATWAHSTVPTLTVKGITQRPSRVDLVAGSGFLVAVMRVVDSTGRTSGNAYSVSTNHGATWTRAKPISTARSSWSRVSGYYNADGLRSRAVLLAGGTRVFWAYGDGRLGYTTVFGALISAPSPGPTPTPSPSPSPTPTPPPSPTPTATAAPTPSPTPVPNPTAPPEPTAPPTPAVPA